MKDHKAGFGVAARAGRYVRGQAGYRVFLPAALPPDPPVELGDELRGLLSQADRALGRLDGAISTLPAADRLARMFVRKEAVCSSRIEGIASALPDLLDAEAGIRPRGQARDTNEVVNYIAALDHGVARMAEGPGASVALFRDVHERLLRDAHGGRLHPGELRRQQTWIGRRGGTVHDAVFVPPPPEQVRPALEQLATFLQDPGDLPLLVWIGLAHAQFETIHPFADGNGRMGRLLITFLLQQQALLRLPVLYLSHYVLRWRAQYYDTLQAVRDEDDWEGWLAYFLRGVIDVSAHGADTARRLVELRERHLDAVASELRSAGTARRVLELLYQRPTVMVTEVREVTGTSYTAANTLVGKLEAMGILEEAAERKRHRLFRYAPYVALFAGD